MKLYPRGFNRWFTGDSSLTVREGESVEVGGGSGVMWRIESTLISITLQWLYKMINKPQYIQSCWYTVIYTSLRLILCKKETHSWKLLSKAKNRKYIHMSNIGAKRCLPSNEQYLELNLLKFKHVFKYSRLLFQI